MLIIVRRDVLTSGAVSPRSKWQDPLAPEQGLVEGCQSSTCRFRAGSSPFRLTSRTRAPSALAPLPPSSRASLRLYHQLPTAPTNCFVASLACCSECCGSGASAAPSALSLFCPERSRFPKPAVLEMPDASLLSPFPRRLDHTLRFLMTVR